MSNKPAKVELGYKKDYTVTEGMSSKKYGGFIERSDAKMEGCMLPPLAENQCAVLFYPEKKPGEFDNSNDWEVQCVLWDAPEKGMIPKDYVPYKVSMVDNKDMILKCGHDQGDKLPCSDGNNSARGGELQKQLKDKKQAFLSVCGYAASKSDPKEYQGAKVLCQYYNKPEKKVLFGFEYTRAMPK